MIVCQVSTLMGARRMNQSQLAARTGIHRDTIRKLYYDSWTSIRRDALDRLCTILEVSVGDLFAWRREEPLDQAKAPLQAYLVHGVTRDL